MNVNIVKYCRTGIQIKVDSLNIHIGIQIWVKDGLGLEFHMCSCGITG